MAEQKFSVTDALSIFNALREAGELVRGYIETAKENGEMTPEQAAKWLADLQAYRASPAGTPTPAGKL